MNPKDYVPLAGQPLPKTLSDICGNTIACEKDEGLLGAGTSTYANSQFYLSAHRAIQGRIDYHNRQSHQLQALYRSLPRELTPDADRAFVDLLSGPKW